MPLNAIGLICPDVRCLNCLDLFRSGKTFFDLPDLLTVVHTKTSAKSSAFFLPSSLFLHFLIQPYTPTSIMMFVITAIFSNLSFSHEEEPPLAIFSNDLLS